MSARRYKSGWWCDFRFEGRRYRRKAPINSKRGAEKHERDLIKRLHAGLPINGEASAQVDPARDSRPRNGKEIPEFEAFAAEFMRTYAKANNKLSEQEAKQCHLRCHLLPVFGGKRLDEIGTRQIESFKAMLLDGTRSRKRVNNILATLRRILSYATELEILDKMPRIRPSSSRSWSVWPGGSRRRSSPTLPPSCASISSAPRRSATMPIPRIRPTRATGTTTTPIPSDSGPRLRASRLAELSACPDWMGERSGASTSPIGEHARLFH